MQRKEMAVLVPPGSARQEPGQESMAWRQCLGSGGHRGREGWRAGSAPPPLLRTHSRRLPGHGTLLVVKGGSGRGSKAPTGHRGKSRAQPPQAPPHVEERAQLLQNQAAPYSRQRRSPRPEGASPPLRRAGAGKQRGGSWLIAGQPSRTAPCQSPGTAQRATGNGSQRAPALGPRGGRKCP